MNCRIRSIFAPYLYTVAYYDDDLGEYIEEYDRLLELWSSPEYWVEKGMELGERDVRRFARRKIDELCALEEQIDHCEGDPEHLERLFELLRVEEDRISDLPRNKSKIEAYRGLRLYAIKIKPDVYVITGGALKQSQEMKDHPDTELELNKLNALQAYLIEKGIYDAGSFEEFIAEID